MKIEEAQSQDAVANATPTGPLRPPASAVAAGDHIRSGRPATLPDSLYGVVRVSGWAAALLDTAPFRRLAGVSLSNIPGEILFGRPFPSRLDHVIGTYHLARLARPRDRALQAAALAHDLGHGPFSHLSEPLMLERLGVDHEERVSALLARVRSQVAPALLRQLGWLDWDEVAALVLGTDTGDHRGALLNGLLDYDNIDNVARFLQGAGLGTLGYAPPQLARALRIRPVDVAGGVPVAETSTTVVQASAVSQAYAWQADRARVYRYLHEGHANLAVYAMLRKAVDLAADANLLPATFFDMTNAEALSLLEQAPGRSGIAALVCQVQARQASQLYRCVWEAEVSAGDTPLAHLFARRQDRVAAEAHLADVAGLPPSAVALEAPLSKVERALPPFMPALAPASTSPHAAPVGQPRRVHLFVAPNAARDYVHRLRMAAAQHLGALGASAMQAHEG